MQHRVSIVLSKDKHGYFVQCPELPGCHSQGDTFEKAMSNIKEAVELYLETMSPAEIKEALSKEVVTTTVEVKVA